MAHQMLAGRISPPTPPGSSPEARAVSGRAKTLDRPAADRPGELETLQETEAMLSAAIAAMSPDAEEIRQSLDPPQGDESSPSRPLEFRLIVTAVILVLGMLLLDLLLV